MKSNSLIFACYSLIKSKKLVKIETLRALSERMGHTDSCVERRCRELRRAGLISVIKGIKGAITHYKIKL